MGLSVSNSAKKQDIKSAKMKMSQSLSRIGNVTNSRGKALTFAMR